MSLLPDTARPLDLGDAADAFDRILDGQVDDADTAAFLVALNERGETPAEISAAAQAMRQRMLAISAPAGAIDVCGTGGDGTHSLNISTAVAFVVAAAGVPVAKHGNRALSSRSGAADTLAALGVNIEIGPDRIGACIREAGLGFMFAPAHHSAMRHVGPSRVELGTRKQRATLAQLILAEGVPVRADSLIEGIWGDSPPERAEVSLQSYISGLRKVLEPHRKPRTPSTVLLTHGTGYSLPTAADNVDVRRLTARVGDARALMQQGDAAGAAPLLHQVLADYRPLLPQFEGLAFRDEAADHLDRMLQAAREMSFEARMADGDHRLLVTELETEVERAPLDEGLWVLFATALYRLGRQSDALGAIATARRTLAEEIGVDPGPRLRTLERDILDHAPHLDAPAATAAGKVTLAPDVPAPGPRTSAQSMTDESVDDADLDDAPSVVGRTDELAALHRAVLASMTGHGGVVVVEYLFRCAPRPWSAPWSTGWAPG